MKDDKKKPPASFDDLMATYYGGAPQDGLRNIRQVDSLLDRYYGHHKHKHHHNRHHEHEHKKHEHHKAPAKVSVRTDDGEVLMQSLARSQSQEYVVSSAQSEPAFDEYVVGSAEPFAEASSLQGIPDDLNLNPAEEYRADILDLLKSSNKSRDKSSDDESSALSEIGASPSNCNCAAEARTAGAAEIPGRMSQESPIHDEFLADMKSILSGRNVYDRDSRSMKPATEVSRQASKATEPVQSTVPMPDTPNHQAIFDRIAQSMQYANAYDLGSIELQNRFADFDKVADLKTQAKGTKKKAEPENGRQANTSGVGSAEFIQDLDTIRKPGDGAAPTANAVTQSITTDYSQPFYDTGEHVLTGGNLYEGRLRVGKAPAVNFSYGQIIAMGDLFGSVDEMMAADVKDLQKIKTLIERSTSFYKGNKANRSLDVSDEEWQGVTADRYLKLAEDNYEHFSPDVLFNSAPFAKAAHKHGTNKSAWEAYHQRAIQEAQKAYLSSSNSTVFPEQALITNAFGDHFLTDAFASGHIINKETTIAYFKSNFYNGSSLKPEGKEFFKKLAKACFKGDLAKKFSGLETVDYPVCAWGWCIKWRPNIDSPDRFAELLTTAAEQEPEQVANFAVKALHDRLNRDGVEVFNNAGDGTWTAMGDAYLNPKNLAIIRKAVQQSVDNLNDPAIRASNVNFGTFFAKVWKFVPQLTEASKQKLAAVTNIYVRPDSAELVNAASQIIQHQTNTLIQLLLKENKLKAA